MPAEDALSLGPGDKLIETLGLNPGQGFARLARHLARLSRSATVLGFPCDIAEAEAALRAAVTGDARLRMRLTLDAAGALEVTATPFAPLPRGARWRVAVARHRLDPADPLLAHKTTRRDFYDDARAEAARKHGADEALFLNLRGELCEGGITSLFVERGDVLVTPPAACGLLPGILREELLETGHAREAVLTLEDLRTAPRWFMGNSLRGLISARFVGNI